MIDRLNLANRAKSLGEEVVNIIKSDNTEIEEYKTPFLTHGSIYLVSHLAANHPVIFAIGCAEPDFAVMLPSNPAGFMDLVIQSGLDLHSDQNRISYITTFLQTTNGFRGRFRIIRGVSEIELVNKPSAEQIDRYKKLEQRYTSLIKPPTISSQSPWESVLFALVGQDLVQLNVRLAADGKLDVSSSVLEKGIPIAYAK